MFKMPPAPPVRRKSYYYKFSLLGMFYIKFNNIPMIFMLFLALLELVINVGLLLGAAYLFQMFWAWFIPVVVPMLPSTIPYWHSFATVVFLWAFMPKTPSKTD